MDEEEQVEEQEQEQEQGTGAGAAGGRGCSSVRVQRKRAGNHKGRCPFCKARAGRAQHRGPYVSGCGTPFMHVSCYRAAWQRREHSRGAGAGSSADAGAWAMHNRLCGGVHPLALGGLEAERAPQHALHSLTH